MLAAAFLFLGVIYSVTTPIFEASDELWHYPFVHHLADGNGLPVQDPAAGQAWRQEGSQPPLYYALASLLARLVDRSDFAAVRRLNPHADIGVLRTDGNRNMTVHGPGERFPYAGTALAVHLARWLSLLFGVGTVLLTYALGRDAFPGRPAATFLAAALVAFNPMFLFISASVNNDNLVIFLSSLALYLIVRLGRDRAIGYRMGLIGVVIGLAVLAKVSGLALLAPAALSLMIACAQQRQWRRLVWGGVLLIGATVAVCGWWLARNYRLYGDPLGLDMLVRISGPRFPPATPLQLLGEWQGFAWSFWGLFGGLNVAMPPWAYAAFNGVAAAAVLGLVVAAVGQLRKPRRTSAVPDVPSRALPAAILLAWPIVVFAALVRWTLMTPASQGRLMFAALPAIGIWLAVGLLAWVPDRITRLTAFVVAGVLFLAAVVVPFAVIAPAYAAPPLLAADDVQAIPNRLGVTFGQGIRLLGWELGAASVEPAGWLPITLYWQCDAPVARDFSVFVHLLGEHDLVAAQRDTYPGLGSRPTSAWRPGEAFADRMLLAVPASAYAPDHARIEVGVYDYASGVRLPVTGADGAALGDNVRFGRVEVLAGSESDLPNALEVNFGGEVSLVGYRLDRRSVRPGDAIQLTLYWRALRVVKQDYTVFAHVLGKEDRLWAQRDAQPQNGLSPTSTWQLGTVIEDAYELKLKPDAPPDVYPVEVGVYLPATGRRLSVLDSGGAPVADRVLLAPIRVTAP